MSSHSDCPSCARLGGIVQCNKCRKAAPNAQTLTRRRLAQHVANGATIAQAEARENVTRRIVIG